jgi:hypothetical protein
MEYNQANLTHQSRAISDRKKTTDLPLMEEFDQLGTSIQLQDYVNAFIINEANEVLVFEGTDNGRSWSSWQVIGRNIQTDEDPMNAIQQDLLQRTGYVCTNWIYLGSFVIDETEKIGAGHFFCARLLEKINVPDETMMQGLKAKWVAKRELKQALLDGRIAVINHAVAISLAMVMCNDL